MMQSLFSKPLIHPFHLHAKTRSLTTSAGLDYFKKPSQQQQLNLSALASLSVFLDSMNPTCPDGLNTVSRTEALRLSLAAFSVAVPYLGKFLKGSTLVNQSTLPEGNRQIFVMSENLLDSLKEDVAWGTYVLLKNTNTISMLISVQDALCVRGYWSLVMMHQNLTSLNCLRSGFNKLVFLICKTPSIFLRVKNQRFPGNLLRSDTTSVESS